MSTGRLGAGDTAIQPTLLDAKGDLIAATAADTPARLAVGANGESLVADSSTATGLRWQGSFEAGKNAIINGDFRINQRNFTSVSSTAYCFDRWYAILQGASQSYTAQTFTPGTAPVAGYEGSNFLRIVTVGGASNYAILNQRIEDVRTFAGQTITVSFWAKANSGTPSIGLVVSQNFGSGGSASTDNYPTPSTRAITTSWARYSFTMTLPSISGKTIGTSSFVDVSIQPNNAFQPVGQQSNTFDIWGVQVEAGNVATPFQTATGTLQGELAACQRYYWRSTADANYTYYGFGSCANTTIGVAVINLPVPMRVAPTGIESLNMQLSDTANNYAITSVTINQNSRQSPLIAGNGATGLTQYRPIALTSANTTNSYLALSAEL